MPNQFNIPGLTTKEVYSKIKSEGYNELPHSKCRNIFRLIYQILSEPMFLLLIISGTIYLILGDINEALILLGFVFVVMSITFYQEHKAERAIETLRNLSSPRAFVIRDGIEKRIAGRDVVSNDILIIREGDYVPADAVLINAHNVLVDESLLTGESAPVRKLAQTNAISTITANPGGDDHPYIYASTLVVSGYGIAKVHAIGKNTAIGKIGQAFEKVKSELTNLQSMTVKLVRNLAMVGLAICLLVAIIYGATHDNYINGILAGITLAMAILPEEFPVILTTFLALGALRISKQNVLTRNVPAIEALGAASVLCTDKTGTLTLNEMSVNKLFLNDKQIDTEKLSNLSKDLTESFQNLIFYATLAGQISPFDPMEKAIKHFAQKHISSITLPPEKWQLIQQYPLSKELLAISHAWKTPDNTYVIATKGAPEAIFDLCHLERKQITELNAQVRALASQGLRVIGVAKASFQNAHLPPIQHDFQFTFLGLIGLIDPLRPNAKEAVSKCQQAGIRVIMITGDYPETAKNIGNSVGLATQNSAVITGPELSQMSEFELQKRLKTASIFARIMPEQKLRIVNALRNNREIVAMTGDGVNDAPALKAAHIGIAMGQRGTDVARESADLVLLDDDFSSIVETIKSGRRIFDNIKKAITYTIAVHIPIIGMSLLPVLCKWPLILLPVHIVFLELIINPACSIVFEAEEAELNIMKRPPRNPKETLFTKKILKISLFQSVVAFTATLAIFLFAKYSGYNMPYIRTLTFTTLLLSNLALIFANRSWFKKVTSTLTKSNPTLWWITGGALTFMSLILYVPFLQNVFSFAKPNLIDLAICFGTGILVAIISFATFRIFK